MYGYTNIFYNGQEHGTSCESGLSKWLIWLPDEPAFVYVQGPASNEHSPDVDI